MCPSPPAPLALFDEHSTDEELILFLGGRKVGDAIPSNVITGVNPFSIEPWDSTEYMWYLYKSEDPPSHNGGDNIKITEIGYWRSVNDLKIVTSMPIVGWKITWEFYLGQAPYGDRIGWIMHEYQEEPKPLLGTNKDYRSLYRIFLPNEQITNSQKQDSPINIDHADREYLHSRLPSPLVQDESSASGDHRANRFQAAVPDERSQPASPERRPLDISAYNSVEDVPATFDFSKGDYLELNDLCSMKTSSSSKGNSTSDDFLNGDYLELNDLYSSETSLFSSDNSSLMSMNSDEYFDPYALLRELENGSNPSAEEEHVDSSFSVSTSAKSNQVVTKPSLPGFIRSNESNLVVVESTSATFTSGKGRALIPILSPSAVEVCGNEKASPSGKLEGSQASQIPVDSRRQGSRPAVESTSANSAAGKGQALILVLSPSAAEVHGTGKASTSGKLEGSQASQIPVDSQRQGSRPAVESTSANSTFGKGQALIPVLSPSAAEVHGTGKASTLGKSERSRANQIPGCSQGVKTQRRGSRPAGGIAKYFCFGSF